jgi:hypothetical protein
MFEQDYIVRMFVLFAEAIRKSMQNAKTSKNAQSSADMLEAAIGEGTDIDGEVLLSLSPDSIASIMQVSGTNSLVAEYIARSLLLEAQYLEVANDPGKAALRAGQAYAIAKAFSFEISLDMLTEEEWDEFFQDSIPDG